MWYYWCISILIVALLSIISYYLYLSFKNKKEAEKANARNFKQKKSSLYIKYDMQKEEIVVRDYAYLNSDIIPKIIKVSNKIEFKNSIKQLKGENDNFKIIDDTGDYLINFAFSYRDKIDDILVLRCEYNLEKIVRSNDLKTLDELREIFKTKFKNKAVVYYLNAKDFNSINQRYGQACGDSVLEVLKERISKIENKKVYCSYLGADQFLVYCCKGYSKQKAIKFIEKALRKITKPIDVGYINIDIVFGTGICVGKHEDFEEYLKCAYVAADYAKKRKKYNIVIYNAGMTSEENLVEQSEEELEEILVNGEMKIRYNPVFLYSKSKFVGYIGNPILNHENIDFESVKNRATQKDKIEQLMNILINSQLVNYLKRRPNKNSKLFINLKLEDLGPFLEVYLSNQAYSDCKIVICLNVKKGYEMITKFSNVSSNISKIIQEGIEFAAEINYSNMYEYDYILKNSKYLIIDGSIVSNNANALIKNKVINVVELAKKYELKLFATGIENYVQLENLLKYDTYYFSGSYFGKSSARPSEIEQSRTRVFAKFLKDAKKDKEK